MRLLRLTGKLRIGTLRLLVAAVAAALCASATPGLAEAPYSFSTTPGRLPKTVVPKHYAIELAPDHAALTLPGSVVIDIEVRQPTAELLLNVVDIAVSSATVESPQPQTATVSVDAAAQLLKLTFPAPLAVGDHRLTLAFTGRINQFGRGLFAVDYPTGNGRKRMLASHLEPADARRIFPSFDEPAFKATFALAVTVPRRFLAVSNMPVAAETPLDEARKRVAFQPTPKMSTYLFVLVAGELEQLTGEADGVTVNVIATEGKREHGRYALDTTIALLRYFNDYFGAKYPLPKLDLIAVPGGIGGAMENWGGIVFFESRLLHDPATSPDAARRGIYTIIAHEVAHQWFGNLVTMAWWDNLWLNEGFASWMQTKAADRFHPEWQAWPSSNEAKQRAMGEDARRTTRPIQRPVANETEAMAVFDAITYSKGQAFIRMLESYLGEDAFRAGIRRYMQQHAYSSTTTADLWGALEAASGKPVAALAGQFTEQPGVPLIVSESSCDGDRQRLTLRQARHSIHDPEAAPLRWQVPIAVGPFRAMQPREVVLLRDGTMQIDAGRCGEPAKLNFGDVGYYRVKYDDATHAALARALPTLPPADRINLLADGWALLESGDSPPAHFFELVDRLGDDDNRAVWDQVMRALGRLDFLSRGHSARPAVQAYAHARLRPIFDRLGWDAAAGEDAERAILRGALIRALGHYGDPQIIAEAKRRFEAFLKDPAALPVALRGPIAQVAGRQADRATYDALLALARRTTNADERVRYYFAAAAARDPALARATLALALTDELPSNLRGGLISTVAWSGEQPGLAWEFVRANFAALVAQHGPPFRNYFVSNLMQSFSDPARAEELGNFAPVHATSGGRIVAARAQASIMADAAFRARRLPAVEDWLTSRATRR